MWFKNGNVQAKKPMQRRGFRPCLEALEQRWCPSCSVVVDGDSLVVRGDDTANKVAIRDDGSNVTVSCDGADLGTFAGIQHIKVETFGGDDRVNYITDLPGLLAHGDHDVRIVLGDGNDTAICVLGMNISKHATLGVKVEGGNGNDLIVLATSIEGDGTLDVNVDCGDGDDRFESTWSLLEETTVRVKLEGGAGNDSFSVPSGFLTDIDELRIRGGPGFDECDAPAYAVVDGCEA